MISGRKRKTVDGLYDGETGGLTLTVPGSGENSIAIGNGAGNGVIKQGQGSIAIGTYAGSENQSVLAVAVGGSAGENKQGTGGVAIGFGAGGINQGAKSVAIGYEAGLLDLGANSIAIGQSTLVPANAILLNASGNNISGGTTGTTRIRPVRSNQDGGSTQKMLQYNTSTYEVSQSKFSLPSSLPTSTSLVSLDSSGALQHSALNLGASSNTTEDERILQYGKNSGVATYSKCRLPEVPEGKIYTLASWKTETESFFLGERIATVDENGGITAKPIDEIVQGRFANTPVNDTIAIGGTTVNPNTIVLNAAGTLTAFDPGTYIMPITNDRQHPTTHVMQYDTSSGKLYAAEHMRAKSAAFGTSTVTLPVWSSNTAYNTQATDPGWSISRSSAFGPEEVWKAFDGSDSTFWLTYTLNAITNFVDGTNSLTGPHITISYSRARMSLVSFSIRSSPDFLEEGTSTFAPHKFTVVGSNDNINWTTIFSQNTDLQWQIGGELKSFTVPARNSDALYSSFRLIATTIYDSYIAISRFLPVFGSAVTMAVTGTTVGRLGAELTLPSALPSSTSLVSLSSSGALAASLLTPPSALPSSTSLVSLDSSGALAASQPIETSTISATAWPTNATSYSWYDNTTGVTLNLGFSSFNGGGGFSAPWFAFDGNPSTHWLSSGTFVAATGLHNSSFNTPQFSRVIDGVTTYGQFIYLDMVRPSRLTKYYVTVGPDFNNWAPTQWIMATSNDSVNWTTWHTQTQTWSSSGQEISYTPNSPATGRYVMMFVQVIGNPSGGNRSNCQVVALKFDMTCVVYTPKMLNTPVTPTDAANKHYVDSHPHTSPLTIGTSTIASGGTVALTLPSSLPASTTLVTLSNSGGLAAPNFVDFTPTFNFSGGGTPTYDASTKGKYISFGSLVFLQIYVGCTSIAGCSGTVTISFPFTAASGVYRGNSLLVSNVQGINFNTTADDFAMYAFVESLGSVILLKYANPGGALIDVNSTHFTNPNYTINLSGWVAVLA
jgi:hypothetical protein